MKVKFNKDSIAVEQNYCTTKTVNAYIVYDLNNWSNNLVRNFTLKTACLVQLI